MFNLDCPNLPVYAAAAVRPMTKVYGGGEMVCRFRAIHTPAHLVVPLDFSAFGDVIEDTPEHLHINVHFENLHMVNAIKQAWVDRYVEPDADCVLRLGEPVHDDRKGRAVYIWNGTGRDLADALLPVEVSEVVLGEDVALDDVKDAIDSLKTPEVSGGERKLEDEDVTPCVKSAMPTAVPPSRPKPSMADAAVSNP